MNTKENSANPLSNLLFDFVSLLHNKAEGLKACEKYLRDAEEQNSQLCIEMLNRVMEQDREIVMELKDHLKDMLQNSDQYESSMQQEASTPH